MNFCPTKEELALLRMFYFYGCLNITAHRIGVCVDAEFEKLVRMNIMNSHTGYSNMAYLPCINLIQNM
jgi:hypothetical protein